VEPLLSISNAFAPENRRVSVMANASRELPQRVEIFLTVIDQWKTARTALSGGEAGCAVRRSWRKFPIVILYGVEKPSVRDIIEGGFHCGDQDRY
jgi:hypothetical protein